jgi:hypothetical protein
MDARRKFDEDFKQVAGVGHAPRAGISAADSWVRPHTGRCLPRVLTAGGVRWAQVRGLVPTRRRLIFPVMLTGAPLEEYTGWARPRVKDTKRARTAEPHSAQGRKIE